MSANNVALQGKDDMRMDERLMQMVRLSDALIGADAATARRELHARSYSMTPLGPRLGLVQWVDHTIPLFQARMLLTVAVPSCSARSWLMYVWAHQSAKHTWVIVTGAADIPRLAAAARGEGQQPWALTHGQWGDLALRAGCHHPECHRRLLLASECRLGGARLPFTEYTVPYVQRP